MTGGTCNSEPRSSSEFFPSVHLLRPALFRGPAIFFVIQWSLHPVKLHMRRLPLILLFLLTFVPTFAQTGVRKLEREAASTLYPDSVDLVPSEEAILKPIKPNQRLLWFVNSSVGVESLLLSGPISAGWGTWRHNPQEYPPTWEGFGQRYGMRLTGVVTGNAIQASVGALWGEDPRYFRLEQGTFKEHVVQVLKGSVMSRYADGQYRFGYSKLAGNVGNNFLSNTWRVPSESTASQASLRCVYGLLARMAGNAFAEFWPEVRTRLFKKR